MHIHAHVHSKAELQKRGVRSYQGWIIRGFPGSQKAAGVSIKKREDAQKLRGTRIKARRQTTNWYPNENGKRRGFVTGPVSVQTWVRGEGDEVGVRRSPGKLQEEMRRV